MKIRLNIINVLKIAVMVCCLIAAAMIVHLGTPLHVSPVHASPVTGDPPAADNAAKAKAAFKEASKVFFSPRCANCHAPGEGPTQGDAMKPHDPEMLRGKEGKGTADLSCTDCHLATNTEGEGMPPGVADWHMPAADQKMPFQGLTAGQLCRQIKDPAKNGGRKTPKDSIKHMGSDAIVLWAWSPGNARTVPPMSHADFMKKLNEWVSNGAACPD
jgi:hypothetical protein